MTIFTVFFFSLFWLQMLDLPASLQNKNTWVGPKRFVLQNPDREKNNQRTGISRRLGLPYNKYSYSSKLLLQKDSSTIFVGQAKFPKMSLVGLTRTFKVPTSSAHPSGITLIGAQCVLRDERMYPS